MEYSGCRSCDFYDSEFGCTCPSVDLWYACPYEPEPTLSDFDHEDWAYFWRGLIVSNRAPQGAELPEVGV